MTTAKKVSITMDGSDLAWFRKRAKLLHGGNLSAAVGEAARIVRRQDALRAFLEYEGVPALTPGELEEIQTEWRAPVARRAASKKKKRAI